MITSLICTNIRTLPTVKEIVDCIDRYAITIRRANTRCTYAIGTYFPHTTNFPTLSAVGRIVRCISGCAVARRHASSFETTDSAGLHTASGTDRTKVIAPTAIRRIAGRIDFYAAAIHHAIACFASPLATNQSIAAFVVAAAAMVDMGARIDGRARAIGNTSPSHTGVILAYLAIGAFIRAVTASVDGAHRDFTTAAICRAIAFFALALVTDQAVITAVVAVAAVIQIRKRVAQHIVTYCIAQTATAGALLAAGAGMAVFTTVLGVVGFAKVLARAILRQVIVTFARAGHTLSGFASAVFPPDIFSTICGVCAAGIRGVCFADALIVLNFNVIIGITIDDVAG